MTFGDAYTYAFCIRDYALAPGHGNSLTNLKYFFSMTKNGLVCYTAVLCVVTQHSTPQQLFVGRSVA